MATNQDNSGAWNAAGNAIAVLGNYAAGIAQSRKQWKYQQQAMEKQHAMNMELWNMQNAYNTPQQQMERFKAAGLNPYLIYGSGGSGAGIAGSIPSPTVPSRNAVKPEFNNPISPYLQARQMDVQYEATRQSIQNMQQKASLDAVKTSLESLRLMKEQNRSKNYEALNQAEKRTAQLIQQRTEEMWNNEGLKGQLLTQMHQQRAGTYSAQITSQQLDNTFKTYRNELAKHGVYSSDNVILRTLMVAAQRMGVPIDELLKKAPSALRYLYSEFK